MRQTIRPSRFRTSIGISARINGGDPIELVDDGQHGDGAASDGVYGAFVIGLSDGSYSVLATAEIDRLTRTAATGFTVGSQASLAATPAAAKPTTAASPTKRKPVK